MYNINNSIFIFIIISIIIVVISKDSINDLGSVLTNGSLTNDHKNITTYSFKLYIVLELFLHWNSHYIIYFLIY